MSHEKTLVRGYGTLLEGIGIHHSNWGLQITHDMYINGFFMIVYDLTPDLAASEGDASHPETAISGSIENLPRHYQRPSPVHSI